MYNIKTKLSKIMEIIGVQFFKEFKNENSTKLNQILNQNKTLYEQNFELREALILLKTKWQLCKQHEFKPNNAVKVKNIKNHNLS